MLELAGIYIVSGVTSKLSGLVIIVMTDVPTLDGLLSKIVVELVFPN